MRAFAIAMVGSLSACAASAPQLPATHPANANAPSGRLAGPPPSTRAGAVSYPDVPARSEKKPAQHHHDH